MIHQPIEESEMFSIFEEIAEYCWRQADKWPWFPKSTVGIQLVRSADSIGANLAEGDGRYSKADAIHFFVVARGSARETKLWLKRAGRRGLIKSEEVVVQIRKLDSASRSLNSLINHRRNSTYGNVSENRPAIYDAKFDASIGFGEGEVELRERPNQEKPRTSRLGQGTSPKHRASTNQDSAQAASTHNTKNTTDPTKQEKASTKHDGDQTSPKHNTKHIKHPATRRPDDFTEDTTY